MLVRTKLKSNQQGFAHHFLVPLLAVVLVAVIGGVTYNLISHAQGGSDCSLGTNGKPATISTGANNTGTCVQYARQMVNGVLAYGYLNSNGSSLTARTSTVKIINKWNTSKLSSAGNFDITSGGGFGNQNNQAAAYGGTDVGWVKNIQSGLTNSGVQVGKGFAGMSAAQLTPRGGMSASGNIDVQTWGALCAAVNHIASTGQQNQNNGTDMSGSNKLPMWYIRSYMRTGITAAAGGAANCSGILNPKATTTPPPTTTASWTAAGSAAVGKSSTPSAGKITVPFTATVKNNGPSTASAIGYQTFYFLYEQPKGSTAKWPTKVNNAYTGEKPINTGTKSNVTSGASFSINTSATGVAIPLANTITSGDIEYLCVGVAFRPSSLTAANTGRSTVTGTNQCVKLVTGTKAGTTTGGTNNPPPANVASMTTCNTNQNGANSNVVSLLGGTYHLQSNEWNSGSTFTICTDKNADFTIKTSGIGVPHNGAPGAYPSLYQGCHWGYCTTGYNTAGNLPVLNSDLMSGARKVTTSYATTTVNSGAWDDAYDNWYNVAKTPGNNGSGLEMMIWINHLGDIQPGGSAGPTVNIDGINWTPWHGNGGGPVSFVANSPVNSVSNLDLAPFTAYAVNKGYMPNSWYLIDVEAGFEPWTSGQGLTANSFSVNVK